MLNRRTVENYRYNSETQVGLVGISHKSAPIEIREKISKPDFLYEQFKSEIYPDGEHAILATCNRTEVVFSAHRERFANVKAMFTRTFSDLILGGSSNHEELGMIYKLRNESAVNHFFKVASGLDSMVLGEVEILGQLKAAYRQAVEKGTVKSTLHHLFQSAFRAAKDVRSSTGVGYGKVSVASTAVRAAVNIFGDLKDRKVMVIGAGETASLISKHLQSAGVTQFFISNRSEVNARSLVRDLRGVFVPLDRLVMVLPSVDIVVSAVNLAGEPFLISKKDLNFLDKVDRRKVYCVVDLSVPRSIDPTISALSSLYYFNIDSLSQLTDRNKEARALEAVRALEIIEHNVGEFSRWQNNQVYHQLVGSIFRHFDAIAREEREKVICNSKELALGEANLVKLSQSIEKSYLATSKKIFGSFVRDFKDGVISEEEFLTTLKCLRVVIGS